MRSLIVAAAATISTALVTAAGCGGAPGQAPPNEKAQPAVAALLAAKNAGDVAKLLADDVVVVDGDERFTDKSAAADHLAGVVGSLKLASGVDSHHDVLRVQVTRNDVGGADFMLFGRLDGDRYSAIVLIARPADGALGDDDAVMTAYGDAWGADDGKKRDDLLAQCWSKGGRYVDPTADVKGRDDLGKHIEEFRGQLPGAAVTPKSELAHAAGAVHFRWVTTGLAGLVDIEGMDLGLRDDDGKLVLIAGFFGPLPSL
jgi:hypothetical protein